VFAPISYHSPHKSSNIRAIYQLDLWQISDTEWLLALRRPEPAARKKAGKIVSLVEQLVLPEFGATG
jgi:hypothetical protein